MVEDALQELSLLAVQKREEIADADHLSGWLRTSGRFIALRMIEKAQHEPGAFSAAAMARLDQAWAELDDRNHAHATDALKACLEKLSPSSLALVRERYANNLTGDRLAEAVQLPRRTVYRNLSRILSSLSDCVRYRLNAE
ncbi:MAG: hypothetical protein GC162_08905 [Planctomycetes bacterium]|nr:hypothetical protein [Planctomycetota bacterium]